MDFNSLKEAAANLTLYDVKAGVRKLQNGIPHQHRDIQTMSKELMVRVQLL